jgi:prophage antirepressor-like protein
MNNTPAIFKFPVTEGHPGSIHVANYNSIRVLVDDLGNPRFVAKDVCDPLGFGNPRSSLALLDDDEKGVHTVDTPGGPQKLTTISESGLYSMVLRSRKPEAKRFKKWVTSEVLPSIRKHGMYATPATVESMLADPDTMIQTLQALKTEREARLEAEQKAAIMAPKAQVYDARVADKVESVANISRTLHGVNSMRTKAALMEAGYLYRVSGTGNYRCRAPYRETHFVEKLNQYGNWELYVLPKGKELIVKLYREGRLHMKVGFEDAWKEVA